MTALLELENIDTYYGQIHILQGVDLVVGAGELVCLLGGNASGKSTTLKTILGLVSPRRGSVRFAGEEITGRPTAHRIARGLAIVPENRRVFAPMTVLENLQMGAYLRPKADLKEEFERVYTLFPLLYDRRRQLAGTMSGGEQQMLAMGRALMSKPKLLLMDEPSMGLAPVLVERSFEIIKQVHESGVAMLVVEQNANVSLSIADRGYVLSTGRVVLEGKAADLLENEDLRKAYLVGSAIRQRFPVFRDKVYVNSCSQGALSDSVRAAYEEYLDGWDENGAEWEHWVERSEAARAAFAGLLGASSEDVAIQTSVSAAVSGLVSALQFRGERNRIVISENEFPTIGQIAHAQELRGAEVVQVEPHPEAYAAAIDERTALVASTFVSFRTGAVHDVEAIYGLAREHGALMLVDGYQGIGALPLEASKAGDVVVGGTVKYLLASAGLSFMALRPGLVEELVPVQTGWFADENVFDMQIERYRPHRSARRFDAGTPPVPNIYGGVAGVELIAEAGVPAIAEHVRGLVARLRVGIEELGASVAAEPHGPLVCIRSTDAPALVASLAEESIVTSERDSNLRVSLHLYNTEDDVDAVLAALATRRALLA